MGVLIYLFIVVLVIILLLKNPPFNVDVIQSLKDWIQKNKGHILIAIGVVASIMVCNKFIFEFRDSMSQWENAAVNHIHRVYEGDFTLISSSDEGEKKYFEFVTADENTIQFSVVGWWGGIDLPCGDMGTKGNRHFGDNLLESIDSVVVCPDDIYDVTGKTIEEILVLIFEKNEEAQIMYDFYENVYHPSLTFHFRYNDKEATYTYSKTTVEQYLAEAIYEDLIEPNLEAEE